MLDNVATVGNYDPIAKTELETHIDDAAKANFTIDNCLVHSNFDNLQGTRLGDLPDHTILAFTVVGSPGLDWTYEESSNLADILARHSEVALSKPCYLLFADGRIGELVVPSQIINQLSHPRESAIYTDKEVILNKIVLLTEAVRIPAKKRND